MKQITKHKIRRIVAYAIIIASILLVLFTDAAYHIGWVLILIAIFISSTLWFMYEEDMIKRLETQKASKGKKWTR